MKRVAFKMQLNEGQLSEYIKRHKEIWPELKALLKEAGISEYSIFIDQETNTLFAFQKQKGNRSSQELKDNPIVQKWWDYMADIMKVNKDNSPVSMELDEIFYLE